MQCGPLLATQFATYQLTTHKDSPSENTLHYPLSRFSKYCIMLQLPQTLPDGVVVPGDLGGPPPRLLAEGRRGGLLIDRYHPHGVVVAGFEFVLDVLLQDRVVQVAALYVVLPGELFRLVPDRAEGILHGRTGEEFGAAHQGEVLGHLVVHVALHRAHGHLEVDDEVARLVGVCGRQAQEVVVPGTRRLLLELLAFGEDLGTVLLERGDGLEERTFLLF